MPGVGVAGSEAAEAEAAMRFAFRSSNMRRRSSRAIFCDWIESKAEERALESSSPGEDSGADDAPGRRRLSGRSLSAELDRAEFSRAKATGGEDGPGTDRVGAEGVRRLEGRSFEASDRSARSSSRSLFVALEAGEAAALVDILASRTDLRSSSCRRRSSRFWR